MLFALDWIKTTWQAMVTAVEGLTGQLSLHAVALFFTGTLPVFLAVLLAGIVLCTRGLWQHKWIHGMTGALLLGSWGWTIGYRVNPVYIRVPLVYAMLLGILGFFLLYMLYFLNVLAGGWLLMLAVNATIGLPQNRMLGWIALLLAVIYTALYIKYKMSMTAFTGSLLLALLLLRVSAAASVMCLAVGTAAGIYVQRILRTRRKERQQKEAGEQRQRYPYGPGLAYGWQEPERSSGK